MNVKYTMVEKHASFTSLVSLKGDLPACASSSNSHAQNHVVFLSASDILLSASLPIYQEFHEKACSIITSTRSDHQVAEEQFHLLKDLIQNY